MALPLEFSVSLLKIMSLSGAIMSTMTTCLPARLLAPLTVTLIRSPGFADVDETPKLKPLTDPVGEGLAVVGLAVAVTLGEAVVMCDELELALPLALDEPADDGDELGVELFELHAATANMSGRTASKATDFGPNDDIESPFGKVLLVGRGAQRYRRAGNRSQPQARRRPIDAASLTPSAL